jgi:hypothetical protein
MEDNRHRIVTAAVVLSLPLLFGCEDETRAKVRPLTTATKLAGPSLFLRTGEDQRSLLLLALSSGETPPGWISASTLNDIAVKRKLLIYGEVEQKVDVVDGRKWTTGGKDFVDCTAQLDPFHGKPLRFDGSAKRLLFDERDFATAGRSVLRANLSPDRKYVAALSAEGEYQREMIFGRPHASGKRFHQVFQTADGKQIGDAIVLSDAPESDDVNQCWSPDGRWVVYDDANFERVWIVPGVKDDAGEKIP